MTFDSSALDTHSRGRNAADAFDNIDSEDGLTELSLQEGLRGLSSAQRLQDAIELAKLGLGPGPIAELTHWQHSFTKKIVDKISGRSRGGRMRTGLTEVFRVPVLHATVSRFCMALEHQLQFWQEKRLSSRGFLSAVSFVKATMPAEMQNMPATALYSIANEAVKGTVKVVSCSRCRGCYAQATIESRLTDMVVYDCPFCRQVAAMSPGRTRHGDAILPVSLADLNLRGPMTRYPSKGADSQVVRAVIGLVHSIGSGAARAG